MKGSQIIDLARNKLLSYAVLMNERYRLAPHLVSISKELEAVERGENKRLIITIPPRHGKSMLVSEFFPAWYMGRNPDKYIITSTYGQELSSDFGRKVRRQMTDTMFRAVFPHSELREDTQASHRMSTKQGGEYFAVGVGGAITGRGAHLLLVDDPIKGREEADSELQREKINEWFGAVAYTRLMPGGAIIIVMTRWHENDLVGYVKEKMPGEWRVVDLPALNEHGEPLWSEAYPKDTLLKIKQALPEYDWLCLYQQNPVPKEGNLFKASWLKSGLASEYAATYMALDPAISKGTTADETAFCVFGVDYSNPSKFYEIETVHGRFDLQETLKMGELLCAKHKVALLGVENVAYQKVLGDEFARKGLPVVQLKADTDKARRAYSISHLFSQGRVFINNQDLRNQLLRFRGVDGDKDDMVDAMVHCLRMINECSSDAYIKRENPLIGLKDRLGKREIDPASYIFWEDHYKDMEPKSQGQEFNEFYGL